MRLTTEELQRYDAKVSTTLSIEAAAWIAEGRVNLRSAANP